MNSINKIARVAGLLYLSFVPLAFFGFPYGSSDLFVPGNAAATANNIMASESQFRLSIVITLLGAIVMLFVVLVLYKLLKPVNKNMVYGYICSGRCPYRDAQRAYPLWLVIKGVNAEQ
jgi:hypothetical protein